ncbi:methyltransferase domain-containing protein [Paenibacillus sp. H1-7]|uniref:class I SAM-dependent methyltransferase n=1 Tax=Paenibacillus sp. H1-7 TaxID=2282849 RepID=UPI001EF850D1|nr:methyltransferase domain-containing protein [Paenibacillus sp. H1-7]
MSANLSTSTMEKVKFLYKFIRTPRTIGSVTPSSRYLTHKMIDAVPWSSIHCVAELGCGTGVMTKAIHRKMMPNTTVLLFEKDSHLRKQLALQFPESNTYADAKHLCSAVREAGFEHVDCVISGLPFANFPQPVRNALMDQVRRALRPGGYFIAFQYSLQMKKQLASLFHIESIRFEMRNVPPAFVYVCRKR